MGISGLDLLKEFPEVYSKNVKIFKNLILDLQIWLLLFLRLARCAKYG